MLYDVASNVFRKLSLAANVALSKLEMYVNGAILQRKRIEDCEYLLKGSQLQRALPGGTTHRLMQQLFLDVHFFFICTDKVQNLVKTLASADGDPAFIELWKRWEPRFKPFNDARNHLEHIGERITSTEPFFSDLGNLRGDTYTFGGEKYDIGPGALDVLTQCYEEVISLLEKRPRVV